MIYGPGMKLRMSLAAVLVLIAATACGAASWSRADQTRFLDRVCIASEMDCACALREAQKRWTADELFNSTISDGASKLLALESVCPRI